MIPQLNILDLNISIAKNASTGLLTTLKNVACKTPVKTPETLRIKTQVFYEPKDALVAMAQADRILESKSIVAINYMGAFLRDKDVPIDNTTHISTVVGRRYNNKTNSCEYLIRNSWGRSCNVYDTRLECDEGNLWVPRADLFLRSNQVTYLE